MVVDPEHFAGNLVEDDPVEETAPQGSLVDLIKQDLQELENAEDVYIPVMGYEASGLSMHFRLPKGGKELDAIARKVETQTKQLKDPYITNLFVAMDTILGLCTGFFVKPAGVDDWVMLDPTDAGIPVLFDDRLATIIGLQEGALARDILKKLYRNNEIAIIDMAQKLNRWMTNTKADLTVELWQLGGL